MPLVPTANATPLSRTYSSHQMAKSFAEVVKMPILGALQQIGLRAQIEKNRFPNGFRGKWRFECHTKRYLKSYPCN